MQRSNLDQEARMPFLMVASAWLLLALGLTAWVSGVSQISALAWVVALWALSVFDLYALSRAISGAFELASGTSGSVENRGALIIQTSYWGVIKLACLGTFGAILSMNGRSIPVTSLLMGPGTLVVVPLFGGYWWSQRVLNHA